MSSLETIKHNISDIKSFLVSKYHISDMYLFGSYAKNEQTKDSDIDILVDFDTTPDLLTFIELEEYLSDKLQQKVDLVPKRKLKSQLKSQILSESIAL
ncbi:MAG: nucleotidyltransferase family protein [Arcobacteraceae bacterium]|nr:nucleotidyltransferase family protein [Arcobacteraceae bacterium]